MQQGRAAEGGEAGPHIDSDIVYAAVRVDSWMGRRQGSRHLAREDGPMLGAETICVNDVVPLDGLRHGQQLPPGQRQGIDSRVVSGTCPASTQAANDCVVRS